MRQRRRAITGEELRRYAKPALLQLLVADECIEVRLDSMMVLGGSPRFSSTTPTGAQRGTTLEVRFSGDRLTDAKEIVFYEPGIRVTRFNSVKANRVKAIVGRDLPLDELVKGHVLIECFDDKVAVVVGIIAVVVLFVAIRFTKAGDIKPVPCPAWAELFVGEELVNEFVICFWRLIVDEGLDLLRRWR